MKKLLPVLILIIIAFSFMFNVWKGESLGHNIYLRSFTIHAVPNGGGSFMEDLGYRALENTQDAWYGGIAAILTCILTLYTLASHNNTRHQKIMSGVGIASCVIWFSANLYSISLAESSSPYISAYNTVYELAFYAPIVSLLIFCFLFIINYSSAKTTSNRFTVIG